MCNCIKKIEAKALKQNIKNKTISNASFISGVIMFSTGITQSCSEVELEVEGQKKKITQKILHTYCPFCGKKYPTVK